MHVQKKSERKLAMREEAKRKVRPVFSNNLGADRTYRDQVESGRCRLGEVAAEGGDSRAKRARDELHYLLNNYMPSYDARIEQLIDTWRRSGDPSYDPGIRVRLRQARRDHMSKTSAI